MATEPILTPSQHSGEFSTEFHSSPGRTLLRLVWPTVERSGPYSPGIEGTPHQLWDYIRVAPNWPWNIRVMADGTVEQQQGMTQDELNEAQYVLYGGHQYVVEEGSWLHQTLLNAGLQFEEAA